jgi:hypothetical protein
MGIHVEWHEMVPAADLRKAEAENRRLADEKIVLAKACHASASCLDISRAENLSLATENNRLFAENMKLKAERESRLTDSATYPWQFRYSVSDVTRDAALQRAAQWRTMVGDGNLSFPGAVAAKLSEEVERLKKELKDSKQRETSLRDVATGINSKLRDEVNRLSKLEGEQSRLRKAEETIGDLRETVNNLGKIEVAHRDLRRALRRLLERDDPSAPAA